MTSLDRKALTQPIYVRLPVEVSDQIRLLAKFQGRTLSLQIRWLLQKALQIEEEFIEKKK